MNQLSPLVTIVVAIRNVGIDLKQTLDDFDTQGFQNFEVLIADCNSTDDPGQYLIDRRYPIRHVMQGDTGIYDAWNKVLPLAQGEWLLFMGAGDTFVAPDVLECVASHLSVITDDVLMAYGKVDVMGENGKVVQSCGAPWPTMRADLTHFGIYPHQATFQRRRTLDLYGTFNDQYRICGDIEMVLRLAGHQDPVFIPVVVAHFQFGGTSTVMHNRLSTIRERHRAMLEHGLAHSYWKHWAKANVSRLIAIVLSERSMQQLVDAYRHFVGREKRFG